MEDTTHNENEPITPKWLAQIITLGALAIALVHLLWPKLAIDSITLALIAIAIIPWLAPIFKSLEIPGGWKVEFKELKKAADRAERAGILAPEPANVSRDPLSPLSYIDPNLAFAAIRIEIEKRVRILAQKHTVPIGSLTQMLSGLVDKNVLDKESAAALRGLIAPLNHAVHGGKVEPSSAELTFALAPRLLKYLDNLAGRTPEKATE